MFSAATKAIFRDRNFTVLILLVVGFFMLVPVDSLLALNGGRGMPAPQNPRAAQPADFQAPDNEGGGQNIFSWGWDMVTSIGDAVNPFTYVKDAILAIISGMGWAVLQLIGFILWLTGLLFDFVLQFTIVDVGDHLSSEGGLGSAIDDIWTVARDISNMIFIFVLLFIAVLTILQSSQFDTKKTLVVLVVVALLINFSMFFTKVIIDAGNYLAVGIHSVLLDDADPDETSVGWELSGRFMDNLQIGTTFKAARAGEDGMSALRSNVSVGNIGHMMVLVTGGGVVMLAAAVAFLMAAITLTIRFILLIFYLITSPIAFVFHILPQTKGLATRWWRGLIAQTFYAPIFLFLIWAAFEVMEGLKNSTNGQADLGDVLTHGQGSAPSGTAELFFILTISLGLFYAAIIIGKKLGEWSGEQASKAGDRVNDWMGKKGLNWGKGAGGFAAAHTLGRAAAAAERKMKSGKGGESKTGTLFRQAVTQPLAGAKFGTGRSFAERQKAEKDRKARYKTAEKLEKDLEAFKEYEKAKRKLSPGNPAYDAAKEEAEKRASKLSMKDVQNMDKKELNEIAEILPNRIIDMMEKSDEFTEEQLSELLEARQEVLEDAVNADDESRFQEMYSRMGDKDKERLGDTASRVNVGQFLKASQVQELEKGGQLNSTQKKNIRTQNHKRFDVDSGSSSHLTGRQAADTLLNNKKEWGAINKDSLLEINKNSSVKSALLSNIKPLHLEAVKNNADSDVIDQLGTMLHASYGSLTTETQHYITTGQGKDIFTK